MSLLKYYDQWNTLTLRKQSMIDKSNQPRSVTENQGPWTERSRAPNDRSLVLWEKVFETFIIYNISIIFNNFLQFKWCPFLLVRTLWLVSTIFSTTHQLQRPSTLSYRFLPRPFSHKYFNIVSDKFLAGPSGPWAFAPLTPSRQAWVDLQHKIQRQTKKWHFLMKINTFWLWGETTKILSWVK